MRWKRCRHVCKSQNICPYAVYLVTTFTNVTIVSIVHTHLKVSYVILNVFFFIVVKHLLVPAISMHCMGLSFKPTFPATLTSLLGIFSGCSINPRTVRSLAPYLQQPHQHLSFRRPFLGRATQLDKGKLIQKNILSHF